MTTNYLLTTSIQFLNNVAQGFEKNWGDDVILNDNALAFLGKKANGRFDFYEIEAGLSICIINCSFSEEVNFEKQVLPVNDYMLLQLTTGEAPIFIKNNNGLKASGIDWQDAAVWSSSSSKMDFKIMPTGSYRGVWVLCSRRWFKDHFESLTGPEDNFVKEIWEADEKKFIVSVSTPMLLLLEEMSVITGNNFDYYSLFINGCIKRLITLAIKGAVRPPVIQEQDLDFQEVLRVSHIKQQLENNLDVPLPTLEHLAEQSNMSKTKFVSVFKRLYKKNYSEFFTEARIHKAAELISKGVPVKEAGYAIGYKNIGYFAKIFKDHFNVLPKQYGRKRYKFKLNF